MDRDEAIRRAEMFLSWLRGEGEYQYTDRLTPDEWVDLPPAECNTMYTDIFLQGGYLIRLKPKPARCWVWRWESGHHGALVEFSDEKPSKRYYDGPFAAPGQWIPMIEDTNETP